ncbi:hypothetical protein [Dactylosporangium sp. NPDC049140]|uniref:hypothetical protein n=1 Tax=Dactylosporangium sp. NPDC049140 TaxID=3155647 RepID=UPI0033F333C8
MSRGSAARLTARAGAKASARVCAGSGSGRAVSQAARTAAAVPKSPQARAVASAQNTTARLCGRPSRARIPCRTRFGGLAGGRPGATGRGGVQEGAQQLAAATAGWVHPQQACVPPLRRRRGHYASVGRIAARG